MGGLLLAPLDFRLMLPMRGSKTNSEIVTQMEVWWERGGTCEREGLGAAAVLFALAHERKWGACGVAEK